MCTINVGTEGNMVDGGMFSRCNIFQCNEYLYIISKRSKQKLISNKQLQVLKHERLQWMINNRAKCPAIEN